MPSSNLECFRSACGAAGSDVRVLRRRLRRTPMGQLTRNHTAFLWICLHRVCLGGFLRGIRFACGRPKCPERSWSEALALKGRSSLSEVGQALLLFCGSASADGGERGPSPSSSDRSAQDISTLLHRASSEVDRRGRAAPNSAMFLPPSSCPPSPEVSCSLARCCLCGGSRGSYPSNLAAATCASRMLEISQQTCSCERTLPT